MAEKKGTILIRFPDELAKELRMASAESNIPIKDIVSEIVKNNLLEWRKKHAKKAIEATMKDAADLINTIEEIAASRGISVEQVYAEMQEVGRKILVDPELSSMMEAVAKGKLPPETLEKLLQDKMGRPKKHK